jgi:hypothetical protein
LKEKTWIILVRIKNSLLIRVSSVGEHGLGVQDVGQGEGELAISGFRKLADITESLAMV